MLVSKDQRDDMVLHATWFRSSTYHKLGLRVGEYVKEELRLSKMSGHLH